MDLTVIILNWNSKQYIDPCLQSLLKTTLGITKKEIILVDNGSTDGSVSHIKTNYPEVILIENDMNKGVAPARNQGLLVAKGRYILILDIDTIVHDNAIEVLIQTLEEDENIGLCGPKLIGIDGDLQYTCRNFPTVLSKIYRQLPSKWQNALLRDEELRDWSHDSLRNVGYVIGACQLIRRKAFVDIGYLDSKMFYGVEEVDFCLRLWKKDWKVVYNPKSVITHVERRIGRQKIFSKLQIEHLKSIKIFFFKHKYILRPPVIVEESKGSTL